MFDPHSRPEWSDIEFYRIGRCSRNRSAGAGSGARAWSTPCAGDTRAAGLRLRGLCREADATPPGRFLFRHVKPGLLFGCRRVDLGAGQHAFVAEPEKALLDIVHLQPGGDDEEYLRALRLNFDALRLDILDAFATRSATSLGSVNRPATACVALCAPSGATCRRRATRSTCVSGNALRSTARSTSARPPALRRRSTWCAATRRSVSSRTPNAW